MCANDLVCYYLKFKSPSKFSDWSCIFWIDDHWNQREPKALCFRTRSKTNNKSNDSTWDFRERETLYFLQHRGWKLTDLPCKSQWSMKLIWNRANISWPLHLRRHLTISDEEHKGGSIIIRDQRCSSLEWSKLQRILEQRGPLSH